MKRSFKKAIAVLLTVLMVVCSLPFTALADAGEDRPDIRIQFGTFHLAGADWQDYEPATVSGSTATSYTEAAFGLYDVPVEYDYHHVDGEATVSGNLYMDYNKINANNRYMYTDEDGVLDEVGYAEVEEFENREFGVGDYFTATFYMDASKVTSAYTTCQAIINHSANIEPAGAYAETVSTGSGKNKKTNTTTTLCSVSELPDGKSFIEAGNDPVYSQSIVELYNTGASDGSWVAGGSGFQTYVQSDVPNQLFISGGDPNNIMPGIIETEGLVNPDNCGEYGYLYENRFILATFVFKIVGEGEITFGIDDFDHASGKAPSTFYASGSMNVDNFTTYTKNNFKLATGYTEGDEYPGSAKMTFFGKNIFSTDDPVDEHEHSFEGAVPVSNNDGTHTLTCTAPDCDKSEGYQVPATCTAAADKVGVAVAGDCQHPGYTGDVVCAECDYVMEKGTEVPGAHNYTSEVTTAPTCESAGITTWTCGVCGDSYTTDAPEATGHAYTVAQQIAGDDENHAIVCANDATHTNGTAPHAYGDEIVIDEPDYANEGSAKVVCADCGYEKTYTLPIKSHEHNFIIEVEGTYVAPKCGVAGKEATMKCEFCDATQAGAPIAALEHNYVADESTYVAPKCGVAGKEADKVCSLCDDVIPGAPIAALEHNYVADESTYVAPKCGVAGKEADKVCSLCGDVIPGAAIDALEHNYVADESTYVAPQCGVAGKEADKVCSLCGDVIPGAPIDALEHDYVVDESTAVAPKCETAGKEADKVCSLCGDVIPGAEIDALGHDYVVVEGSAKEATVYDDGKEADQACTRCDSVIPGAVIPALKGYDVTVEATGLGTVTLNGVDVTSGKTIRVKAGDKITLEATPADGATFVGWVVNGKTTIDTNTTHDATVLANITYRPVFETAAEDMFTVTFVDAFGNVVSSRSYKSAADIVIPAAPTRPNYSLATENGWDMTNDEIKAITENTVITAQYVLDAEKEFTVTAPGCVIVAGDQTGQSVTVPYGTKATITGTDATKAWTVKDAETGKDVTVGFGSTYTFFVTADITITAVEAAVNATPVVANVGVSTTGAPGAVKAVFKATRTMAPGYTYVNSGFVYGKGDLGAITLDDVDGSAVKAIYNSTASEQFSLSYGLKAQSGTMTAVAFIAYADASGAVSVYYAEKPMTYTY